MAPDAFDHRTFSNCRSGDVRAFRDARCLEEQLVAEPADVDFGMIMGTGFAPFRGGPLRFADNLGIPKLVSDMKELAVRGGERFGPCALLNSMAAENRTFYS